MKMRRPSMARILRPGIFRPEGPRQGTAPFLLSLAAIAPLSRGPDARPRAAAATPAEEFKQKRPALRNGTSTMAKSQFKAGGPTRGRRRVRKIGMGSGKYLLARKDARKGVVLSKAEKGEDKG